MSQLDLEPRGGNASCKAVAGPRCHRPGHVTSLRSASMSPLTWGKPIVMHDARGTKASPCPQHGGPTGFRGRRGWWNESSHAAGGPRKGRDFRSEGYT